MDRLIELFLSEDALLRYMIYACQRGSDPVINVLYVMLNEELQFVVNHYGLTLYKSLPVFPWTHMDAAQRECVYQLVFHAHDKQHSAYAVLDHPLKFSVENNHIVFEGCRRLDGKQVFDLLLRAMRDCKRPSRMLLNIIMQKLSVRMVINKQLLVHVHENVKCLED